VHTGNRDDTAGLGSATAIRAELRKLRASIARIEQELDRRPRPHAPRQGAERERPARYFGVLVSIYERGGRPGIAADELGAIGAEHGYDRRGLGGFFAGERAPLRLVEGRVRLTPEGLRLVDRHLQELTG
jgi:hypothetical protein